MPQADKWIGAAIGLIGFAFLIIHGGWITALAILLIVWGNNLERGCR